MRFGGGVLAVRVKSPVISTMLATDVSGTRAAEANTASCPWQAVPPASLLVAGIRRPATRGRNTTDLEPAEFLQQEEKLWTL
jgi:hypothetical protein